MIGTIVSGNFGLKGVVEMSRLVAGQNSPVLLLLRVTGVGKELVANFIHQHSSRKDGPFIRANSGAIPDTLIDSELFGHEKGAFTGAAGRKIGRFERAHRGTTSLDEIAELPLLAQVRLKNYSWPGNVRERENVVEREIILNKNGPRSFRRTSCPSETGNELFAFIIVSVLQVFF